MRTKSLKQVLVILGTVVFTYSSNVWSFYGRQAAEAQLSFEAKIDVNLSDLKYLKQVSPNGDLEKQALELVDYQIQHLMGTFQSASFIEETGVAGTLGEEYKIKFTKIEDAAEPGYKTLTYTYLGSTLFDKSLFKHSRTTKIPVRLPLDPVEIYYLNYDEKKDYNPCTDDHYNSIGDFWYFWDPEKKGCPLRTDKKNVVRIKGSLERTDKFKYTYPEYDRLFDAKANGGTLDISVFLGYIADNVSELEKPNRKDDGYTSFKELTAELLGRGFKLVSKRSAFGGELNAKDKTGMNFENIFEKVVTPEKGSGLPPTLTRIKILLSDTSINVEDPTFHKSIAEALKTSEIVVYDGHSGLGANLDIENISDFKADGKNIKLNKNKYQLLFINGCSSYRYYNYMYFKAKGGSKNVDIISAGLETSTDVTTANIMTFLSNIVDGKPRTYQKILQDIEKSNGEENGTFLLSVSGDEDNQWRPK